MNGLSGNGEAMVRLRCASVGVAASVATTFVFLMTIVLLFRFTDLRIDSVPRELSRR